MKYITALQNKMSGFKPQTHWKGILVCSFFLLMCATGYDVYLYIYAKSQILVQSQKKEEVVSENAASLNSSEQIQSSFEIYKKRQARYDEIMTSLVSTHKVFGTTTASTSLIATSSKQ